MSDPRLFDGYDVVIVGAGISGALLAKRLGESGHRVLILEAGDEIKPNNNSYMTRYYESASKVPESPYTPEIFVDPPRAASDTVGRLTRGTRSDADLVTPDLVNAGRPTVLSVSLRAWQVPDKAHWDKELQNKCDWKSDANYFVQTGALPFASTYERIAGGTARHWLGISLRHLPNDFQMGHSYVTYTDRNGKPTAWPQWPKGCQYADLLPWYDQAEREIGVSGDAAVQHDFETQFDGGGAPSHGYPMAAIPLSYADKVLDARLTMNNVRFPFEDKDGVALRVTPIPAARNSEPFDRRRACAGNSSCIPICPIQAKYDPTITLRDALNTGNVTILYRSVACNVATRRGKGSSGSDVVQIEFLRYRDEMKGINLTCKATAKVYVLAANAIETPRLMLMSNAGAGVTVTEGCPVGRYLMDHPFYIASALAAEPVYPYRGPLVTGGIESMRDGKFRKDHAAFRCDVSNTGWSLSSHGTVQALAEDLIRGENSSGANPLPTSEVKKPVAPKAGSNLLEALQALLTRQVSLGFLVEQTPDPENLVRLSNKVDGLGLPRPEIQYDFSNYTKQGLATAAAVAAGIFHALGWEAYPDEPPIAPGKSAADDGCSFEFQGKRIRYMGAGHIAGTCRMGEEGPSSSVVDSNLRVWDVKNLYILGSAVFPTIGTANPTLTIAALALRMADHLNGELATLKTAPTSPG